MITWRSVGVKKTSLWSDWLIIQNQNISCNHLRLSSSPGTNYRTELHSVWKRQSPLLMRCSVLHRSSWMSLHRLERVAYLFCAYVPVFFWDYEMTFIKCQYVHRMPLRLQLGPWLRWRTSCKRTLWTQTRQTLHDSPVRQWTNTERALDWPVSRQWMSLDCEMKYLDLMTEFTLTIGLWTCNRQAIF